MDDVLAQVGQLLVALGHDDRGQAHLLLAFVDVLGDQLALQHQGIGHEQDVVGLGQLALVLLLLLGAHAEDLHQLIEHIAGLLLVGGHIADLLVLRPYMGEPPGKAPALWAVLAVVDIGQLHVGVGVIGGDLGG